MIDTLDLSTSPVLGSFMQSNNRRRLIIGPFGSGKSTGCAFEVPRRSLMQAVSPAGVRKTRFAVVRNTMPQLRDTTMKTWFDWFPNGSIGYYKETGKTYYIKKDGLDCEVLFRALDSADDVKNLLSLELTGAWLNESREIVKEIVEALDGRIARYPSKKDGGPSWSGIWADTNPPEEGSYWHALAENLDFITGEPLKGSNGWSSWQQPSGLSDEAENRQNLPDDYYEVLAEGKDAEFVKVYVHGFYGTSKGGQAVHPLFRPDLHIAKAALVPNPRLPLIVSADYGLTPAVTIKQQDIHGRVLTLAEATSGKTAADKMGIERFIQQKLIPLLNQKFAMFKDDFGQWQNIYITGDPAGDTPSQTDESTCKKYFKKAGFGSYKSASTNVTTERYGATDHFLGLMTDIGPAYLIDPSCRSLIRGLSGGYHYKEVKPTANEPASPVKNFVSHVTEASHYGDMWFKSGIRSKEVEDRRRRRIATNVSQRRMYHAT